MPSPWPHPDSGVYYLNVRRPAEFRHTVFDQKAAIPVAGKIKLAKIGSAVKVSLETKDRAVAKVRFREADVALQEFWQRYRGSPTALDNRQVHALAGLLYRDLVEMMDGEPGEAAIWDEVLKLNQRVADAGGLDQWFGPSVDQLFAKEGIRTDPLSRTRVVHAASKAIQQAAEVNRKKAQGDYSPDEGAKKYPEWQASGKAGPLDLFSLLDHKFKTDKRRAATREDYRAKLKSFANFIGHSDAHRVTKDDVRKWRDKLIEAGLDPKTINGKYLAALSSTLTHAVNEFSLPENVAKGIRDRRESLKTKGPPGYTEEQAKVILAATFEGTATALSPPHQRAIFWVPWICAYQGLRVTEITQLRGVDVVFENGIPLLMITSDAGATKSNKAWTTAVHPHLVELGLLDMFKAVGDGPAFYAPYPDETDLSALEGSARAQEAGNRVADWINTTRDAPAPLNRPNHAWRHLFTRLSRRYALDKPTRDYMMGSSPVDARESYGDFPPEAQRREIEKLPHFPIEAGPYRPSHERVAPQPIRSKAARPSVPPLRKRTTPRKPRM